MSKYKVKLSLPNYNAKLKSQLKSKVKVLSGVIVPRTLDELLDVDVSNVKDSYVIMYDKNLEKYIAVNPDKVLKKAVVEPEQPGLPNVFLDELDVQLDNRIDLDGGVF